MSTFSAKRGGLRRYARFLSFRRSVTYEESTTIVEVAETFVRKDCAP